jgi:SAM-dependent methyltransferase
LNDALPAISVTRWVDMPLRMEAFLFNQPNGDCMKRQSYSIKFPAAETTNLGQDEAYFNLIEKDKEIQLRFHDYGEIYKRPGLYEQLFYDRLKCVSPKTVTAILTKVLNANRLNINELRVLDLGAGNGMVGELLDAARVVGVDISEDAYIACERDRPDAYDGYYVADLCNLSEDTAQELKDWQLDCMTCVAALGFGDIPTRAFSTAFNLIKSEGWVAFNIKDTFLLESDTTGFSSLIKHLLISDALEIHHLERYRHRISINGEPLFYYAVVGKKIFDISDETVAQFDGR